jgi:mono/diheme cytochrome c family protein
MSAVKNGTIVWRVVGLALFASLLAVTGCQKNPGSAASLPAAQGNSAVEEGRKVFAAKGCVSCHTIGGQGGLAPDLSHVGAKPGHSIDWLMQKVQNPRALNPASRMPPFQGSPKELMALGGYLTGLK